MGLVADSETSVLNSLVPGLLQNEKTFKFIKKFLNKKRFDLSITVPPAWYEK